MDNSTHHIPSAAMPNESTCNEATSSKSSSFVHISPEEVIQVLEAQPHDHYLLQNLNKSTRWLRRLGQILFAYTLSKSIGPYSIDRFDYLLDPEHGEEWLRYRDAIVVRVNNMVVVGSLVITATAVFLSTTSPNPEIADWSHRLSCIAFGLTIFLPMLSVLIGCQIAYLFADLQAAVLRRKRRRGLVFIIIWLLLHTTFLDAALACLLVAVFGAVWGGNSTVAKAGTLFTALISVLVEASWAFVAPILFSDEPEDENDNLNKESK